jgi:hypothetical protein
MKKMFLFLLILSSYFSIAQPSIAWQICLGGTSQDFATSIIQNSDGSYTLMGYTNSNNGDVSGNHGGQDVWIVKLSNSGIIQWQKCLGGTSTDYAYKIIKTTDSGYVFVGGTYSNNGDVSGNHGSLDIWVVKLNSLGEIQWQKCLGGSALEGFLSSINQTSDGGYIIASQTQSNDGDVSGNHGVNDVWVVKLNGLGEIQWQKCLGGTNSDYVYSIMQTTDGGFILAGYTSSNNGDVSGNNGGSDAWVVKLSNIGEIQWQKCLGGTNSDSLYSIIQTADGGYVLSGDTSSNNGDVSGNNGGFQDIWVVKLSISGTIQWQKCLGGTNYERTQTRTINQTIDGDYIISGDTSSNDGDVSGNHGGGDIWVVKLSNSGEILWQKCFGGTNSEGAFSLIETIDGGQIMIGATASNDGDVSGNQDGVKDIWVVKLTNENLSDYNLESINNITIVPNPTSTQININFNNINNLAGGLINVINSLGQSVATTSITATGTQTTMQLSVWGGTGMYFVQIINAQGQIVDIKKIILQ